VLSRCQTIIEDSVSVKCYDVSRGVTVLRLTDHIESSFENSYEQPWPVELDHIPLCGLSSSYKGGGGMERFGTCL